MVREVFLHLLLKAIRALPESTRRSIASGAFELKAISATPLDPAEQEQCRKQIGEAFDADLTIAFRVEHALIAGLELRGPHLIVSNSWRADLTRILADLQHGNRP